MSAAIGPGSTLIAVKTAGGYLNVGSLYECEHVERVHPWRSACGECGSRDGVEVVGVRLPDRRLFCRCNFTPAGRRGQFDELLKAKSLKESPREIIEAAFVRLETNT